ncbi:MAG TPA: hypothetical protein VHT03_01630 [Rhizomicrobium sp.]|jgi:hypothetical protein|nr:hypothetical protein [Rhizomicrobium sp.]
MKPRSILAALSMALFASPAAASEISYMPSWLNVLAYGEKADGHFGDASVTWSAGTAGTAQVCWPGGTFTTADIGKGVTLDLADVGNAPLNTHFTAVASTHCMTVADTITYPSTYILPTWVDVDGANYGYGYLPGDTGHCSYSGCGGAPSYTVKVVQLIDPTAPHGPTINSGGLGGTSGSRYLMGTSAALANRPFVINATISVGGAVTALGSIVQVGYYDSASGSPLSVVPAIQNAQGQWVQDTSNPLTGATINPVFGVAPGGLAMTRSSTAINNFSCPNGSATTAMSGSGSGLMIDCDEVLSAAWWGTDNWQFEENAFTAMLNYNSAGDPKCLYHPAGKYYHSKVWNFTLNGRSYLCGDSNARFPGLTNIFGAPNSAGDMVDVAGCNKRGLQHFGGGLLYDDPTSGTTAGCGIVGILFSGVRESTQHQNAVMSGGECNWCTLDVYCFNMRGRCIGTNADASGNAGWGESQVDYRAENMGDVDQNDGGGHVMHYPSVDLTALGGGSNNNLRVGCNNQARVYRSFGRSVYIADEAAGNAHNIWICLGAHSEGSSMFGTGAGGNLLQLGDNAGATTDWPKLGGGVVSGVDGNISHVSVWGDYTNPQYGTAAILSYNGNDIKGFVSIGGTNEALGRGIDNENCTGCSISVTHISANDYGYTLGGGGSGNSLNAYGSEASVAQNIEAAQQPQGANPAQYPGWTTMPGFPTWTVQNTIKAHPGGGQSNATLLSGAIDSVSLVTSTDDSVKLMAAWFGGCQFVINNGSNPMMVWGYSVSDQINNASSIEQAANTAYWYCSYKPNKWYRQT